MPEPKMPTPVDPADFTLSSFDAVEVEMPPKMEVAEADIDAQLFEYVSNAQKGSRVFGLNDLDDAWVQATFPNLSSMEELRAQIRRELSRESNNSWENLKYQKCADALVARVQGDLPAEVLDEHVEASRRQYAERIMSFGMSKAQYLRQEKLSEEEFEQKMRDDVEHQIKLNVALAKLVEHDQVEVAPEQLTEYLSCDNPETYVDELREGGHLEAAQRAAASVKAMRSVVESAKVVVG